MGRLALSLSLALLLLAALCRGQDFDLRDAVGTSVSTKSPSAVTKKPSDDFNLEDAVDGFKDSDLLDGDLPPEKPQSGHPSNPSSDSPGMLAGIISSVVVAIVGAVSSFIAYQKKKLCFKASDQENIPGESQQGAHAAPSGKVINKELLKLHIQLCSPAKVAYICALVQLSSTYTFAETIAEFDMKRRAETGFVACVIP
ncbi:putative CD99 antigen protein [Naja naja]|nr:putative CD99 antigen protein [Naja naja]